MALGVWAGIPAPHLSYLTGSASTPILHISLSGSITGFMELEFIIV